MKQISNQSVSYEYDALSSDALNHLNSLKFSETKTRRICLHQNTEAELHMMVVDLKSNSKYKLHSHAKSDEIIILLSGEINVHFKDKSVVTLSSTSQQSLIVQQGVEHSVSCGQHGARYIEVIKGPFLN